MNYYKLIFDFEHSDNWLYLHIDESELPFGRYDPERTTTPLTEKRVYCTAAEEWSEPADYLMNDMGWLVVSEKAKTIMEQFEIGKCEFIEMVDKTTGKVVGYQVHNMNHIAAFDEDHAVCFDLDDRQGKEDYDRLMIVQYALKADAVHEQDMFKLKEAPFSYFISEKLKKALQDNRAIGFDFVKVRCS